MCARVCVHVRVCAANISVVVCQPSKVSLMLKQAKNLCALKTIITMGSEVSQDNQQLSDTTGIKVVTFEYVMVSQERAVLFIVWYSQC